MLLKADQHTKPKKPVKKPVPRVEWPGGKHPGGRPPKYETADQLETKIGEYFVGGYRTRSAIVGNKKDGYKKVEIPAITISDLVIFLGFCDRASFYDYEKNPEFSSTIKKARTLIEREYEQLLVTQSPTGAIFALKNFGWVDKQDVDISDNRMVQDILSALPPDVAEGVRQAIKAKGKK